MAVFVRVLGEVSLTRDGARIALPPRQTALLALLVARRRDGITTDELLDNLYDGDPPATAASALRVHIAKLRDALEPGRSRAASSRVAQVHGRWRLRLEDDESDAGLLESTASELGVLDPGSVRERLILSARSAEFVGVTAYPGLDAALLGAARTRLEHVALAAGRAHAAALLDAGQADDADRLLAPLRARHPFDEGLATLAARSAYQLSGGDAALAVVRRFRTLLAEELGLDATHQIDAVESAVLHHDVRLHAVAAEVGAASRGSRRAALLGREEALAGVAELVAAGRSVCLEGPPGIGKSALLRALADEDGAIVASAAGGAPYSLVRSLLTSVPGLSADVPEWRRLRRVGLRGPTDERSEELALIAEDLCRAHLGAGTRVYIDDAENPDLPSLDALADLVGRHLQLVVARRVGVRTGHPWGRDLATVTLGPLDREQTRRLAARLQPDADAPPDLWASTGGVPLLVQLAVGRGTTEPDLGRRLVRHLSPTAVELARALALLGRSAPAWSIEQYAGADALAELLVSRIATDHDGLVGLTHRLVGQALVAGVDRSQRAAVLVDLMASSLPALVVAPAVLERSRDLPPEVLWPWALATGAEALAGGDPPGAQALYSVAEQATGPEARAAAAHGVARSQLATGDVGAARSRLVGVMEAWRSLEEDAALQSAVDEYVGMFAPQSADIVVVEQHARWLLGRNRLSADERVTVRDLWASAAIFTDLEAQTAALLDECERAGSTRAALVEIAARWRLSYHRGRPARERLSLSRRGVELAEMLGDRDRRIQLLRHHIDDLTACGHPEAARHAVDRLEHLARSSFDGYGRYWVDVLVVERILRSGDPQHALAEAAAVHARWHRIPAQTRDGVFQQQAFVALYQLGDLGALAVGLRDLHRSPEADELTDRLLDAALLLIAAETGAMSPDAIAVAAQEIAAAPPLWRRPAELFLVARAVTTAGWVPGEMLEACAPYADEWVLVGTAAATLGPMSMVLADLAASRGDAAMALTCHGQAERACAAMGADWWAREVARRHYGQERS